MVRARVRVRVIMYAASTSILTLKLTLKLAEQTRSLADIVNNELCNVNDWLNINKLSLNVEKTKYIMHTKNNKVLNQIQIKLNNKEIE